MWDLIVSVPDHCLSFYFSMMTTYHQPDSLLALKPRVKLLVWDVGHCANFCDVTFTRQQEKTAGTDKKSATGPFSDTGMCCGG